MKRFSYANEVLKNEEEAFLFILEMATHQPFYDGKKLYPLDPRRPILNYINQVNAIKYVDKLYPMIMKDVEEETLMIITSDHGDLFGPDYWDHSVHGNIRFDERLFRVPWTEALLEP